MLALLEAILKYLGIRVEKIEEKELSITESLLLIRKNISWQTKLLYVIIISVLIYLPILAYQDSLASREMIKKVQDINAAYCSETNEEARAVLLKYARESIPFYPEGGLCEGEKEIRKFIEVFQK